MEDKTRENIDNLVEKLHQLEMKDENNDNQDSDILKMLDVFDDINKISIEENSEFKIDQVFIKLLNHRSNNVVAKTAKAIAEITTTDRGREKCTDAKLINTLLGLLNSDNVDVLTQTTRALSNICYENAISNKMLQDSDGLTHIMAIVKKAVSLKETEGAKLLRSTSLALLFNYIDDYSASQQKAVEENIVPLICSILETDCADFESQAAMRSLFILGVISDSGIVFLNERLCKILCNILTKPILAKHLELCLHLVYKQADDEYSKFLLAETGFCDLMLNVETHGPDCTDDETRSILEIACNLIVLVLTGDTSMHLLYDSSNGLVYKKLVHWLDSTNEDLQVTAILAMANFASTDDHCQLMVEQGIHRKLLELLHQDVSEHIRTRFQHALLCTLRNLVVPASNKSIVLADGLIDAVYPMLNIPTFSIVFKLLGTLRIVIQEQREAAISLGKREDLVEKLVKWCDTDDHPGVQGEANRFIAWLVIHSRDKDVVSTIIKYGGVEHLVKMITVRHARMQNEALMSLSIISAMSLSETAQPLIDAQVGEVLLKFFEQRDPQPDPEHTSNALTLTLNLLKSKSEILIQHLNKSNLLDVSQKIQKHPISVDAQPPTA